MIAEALGVGTALATMAIRAAENERAKAKGPHFYRPNSNAIIDGVIAGIIVLLIGYVIEKNAPPLF